MRIKPFDRDLKNVLETGFYRIPRFQRPYSWDRENIEEFWNDTIRGEDADYFIGSMVGYKKNERDDAYFVVDGQQRLTTATILLAVLRNAFAEAGQERLSIAVQKLIEREDINGDLTFVLQSESSYPYFQEFIQKYGEPELEPNPGLEEYALKQAFEFLTDNVSQVCAAIRSDPSISDRKKPSIISTRLAEIRDKVLRLKVIFIELDNEDDAYVIFETLNTRGKDLEVSDLVKNHIMRNIGPRNRNVDVARDKWNSILSRFAESEADIDVNNFLLHFWLSRENFVAEKKLFKDIKGRIDRRTASKFIDDLVDASKIYRVVNEPETRKWKNEEQKIKDSLTALNLFRVRQQLPMVLSILHEYENGRISLRRTIAALRCIECFHFIFTAITSQRSSGGISQMYSSAARNLLEQSGAHAKARHLREFAKKLRDRVPQYSEFEIYFQEVAYSESNTKGRALAKYILSEVHKHFTHNATIDYAKMTIEHLAPQNPDPAPGAMTVEEKYVAMLGNMIVVPEGLNVKLGAKDIPAKETNFEGCWRRRG